MTHGKKVCFPLLGVALVCGLAISYAPAQERSDRENAEVQRLRQRRMEEQAQLDKARAAERQSAEREAAELQEKLTQLKKMVDALERAQQERPEMAIPRPKTGERVLSAQRPDMFTALPPREAERKAAKPEAGPAGRFVVQWQDGKPVVVGPGGVQPKVTVTRDAEGRQVIQIVIEDKQEKERAEKPREGRPGWVVAPPPGAPAGGMARPGPGAVPTPWGAPPRPLAGVAPGAPAVGQYNPAPVANPWGAPPRAPVRPMPGAPMGPGAPMIVTNPPQRPPAGGAPEPVPPMQQIQQMMAMVGAMQRVCFDPATAGMVAIGGLKDDVRREPRAVARELENALLKVRSLGLRTALHLTLKDIYKAAGNEEMVLEHLRAMLAENDKALQAKKQAKHDKDDDEDEDEDDDD